MATLTIRDLDDEVRDRLRVRAAQHGRSMEAEARVILRDAVSRPSPAGPLGSRVHLRFAAVGGVELDTMDRVEAPRVVNLLS